MILVQAEQNARVFVAEMIDDAVVQTAITGAGIETHIGDADPTQHLGGNITAPGDVRVRPAFDLVQPHRSPNHVAVRWLAAQLLRQWRLPRLHQPGFPAHASSAYMTRKRRQTGRSRGPADATQRSGGTADADSTGVRHAFI